MNCREGDLAVIVKSTACPAAVGKIIRLGKFLMFADIPAWYIDGPEINGHYWAVADLCVKPIRDTPDDYESADNKYCFDGVAA